MSKNQTLISKTERQRGEKQFSLSLTQDFLCANYITFSLKFNYFENISGYKLLLVTISSDAKFTDTKLNKAYYF